MDKGLPTYSIIIEWENALLSELERTREMLEQLRVQIAEVGYPRPTIIILHDQDHIDRQLIERFVGEVSELEAWPADVRIVPTDGLEYYEQKNFGAEQSDSDLIVFLDSDVIPEPGWLAGLLEAFQNPDVQVVCGNTYVSPEDFYSKAFALFWFFPMRAEGDELRRTDNFWANNVAFRRETFEAFRFPTATTFRGQCGSLKDNLRESGIDIFLREGSRVSHPPPNGLRHFVSRGICEGYDAMIDRPPDKRSAASLVTPAKNCVRAVGWSLKRISRHYRDVRLGPVEAVGAFGIAASYFVLGFAGALLTHLRPELVRRHFPI